MRSRGKPPGRSSMRTASRQATMVDSTPTGVGAAVDDQIDAAAEIVQHMLRGGGRDVAGAVGGRRDHRPAEPAQEAARHRMLRHPHGDAVEAGGARGRRPGSSPRFGSTSVSGPGQNARGEPLRRRVEHRKPLGGREIGHMRDQRIERRPALGGVEPRDRRAVGGVGAEPVDRLGRERDQSAVGKADRRVGHGDEIGGRTGGCRAGGHFMLGRFHLARRALCWLRPRPRRLDFEPVESAFVVRCSAAARTAAAIAVGSQWRVSSRNLSRISSRSSGCSGVPLKLSTRRLSVRPSFSVTVTVEAMVWPLLGLVRRPRSSPRAPARGSPGR